MYFWVFHLCCLLSGGALCYCWCSLCLNLSGSSTFWIWSNYPWLNIRPVVSLPCCGGETWLLSVFMSGGRSLIRHLRFVKSYFVFFLIALNAGGNRERISEYGKWVFLRVYKSGTGQVNLGCYRVRGVRQQTAHLPSKLGGRAWPWQGKKIKCMLLKEQRAISVWVWLSLSPIQMFLILNINVRNSRSGRFSIGLGPKFKQFTIF